MDEFRDTPIIVECLLVPGPLVLEIDGYLLVQECLIAEPVLECVVIELYRLEDLRIGEECDSRPCLVGFADDLDRSVRYASVV